MEKAYLIYKGYFEGGTGNLDNIIYDRYPLYITLTEEKAKEKILKEKLKKDRYHPKFIIVTRFLEV